LNTDEVNAFSGPDGYVLITRGAIERMRDESELAGVLGHEISHVVNHDGLNAAKNQGMLKAGLSAAGTNQHFGQFEQLTNGAVDEIITKGYDRKQEDAADAGAVVLVSLAGYDPNGYLHFIQRLAALDKDRSLSIMRTHPGLGDRVNNISKKIAEIKAGGGQTLAARFAANTK
jgi:predicted Zn-dependent protease